MAQNFSITFVKSGKDIHLKLTGDFDGSSALELIYFMNNCMNNHDKVFIDTDSLMIIEPFGINVFRYNLGRLSKHSEHFVFTGNNARNFIKCWPEHMRSELNIIKEIGCFSHNVVLNY
ncbi:MAG: hypothetical protein R6V76_06185 [Desulfobacterales bacterium]